MTTNNAALGRRSYLDALRAGAMLLGIVLHASLSFFPSYWMVLDSRQSAAFGTMFSAIHGFRMPLFFVMSGFFSAMLLHKRGRGALVKHRFQRVFLPLLVGLFTIIPLTFGVSTLAMMSAAPRPAAAPLTTPSNSIWKAAQDGDVPAITRHLDGGTPVNGIEPTIGGTPLMWAAVGGHAEAVEVLVGRGAEVNATDREGGTAMLAASFLGNDKVVEALISHGANVNAANVRGETPLDVASLDEGTTRYFASMLKLELVEKDLGKRKAAIVETLREHGATAGRKTGVAELLMQIPIFNHLWFLWFLWWLVIGYAGLSAVLSRLPAVRLPGWLVLSPARYLWLVPLTMSAQWFMGTGGESAIFGPDTSTGLLPIPHVFAYYAIFFGFGAIYYHHDDPTGEVGGHWWLPLALGLFVLLPLGTALGQGWTGPASLGLTSESRRILSVAIQASYPWLITFGLMGLFRRVSPVESPRMQYLSDSAYWLYLAHLPLVVMAQLFVRDWPIPAVVKFGLIVVVVTAFLLWTYQVMVRYTWIGRFLNGPRTRPVKARADQEVAVA